MSEKSAHMYNQLCHAAGLLPVGCGTSGFDCDAKRYFGDDSDHAAGMRTSHGAECVPMPAAWSCEMDAKLSIATGWRSLVTFGADGAWAKSGGYYMAGVNWAGSGYYWPSAADVLHPVCAKMGPP